MALTNIGGVALGNLVLGGSPTGGGSGSEPPTNYREITHTLNFTQTVKQSNTRVLSLFIPHQTIVLTKVTNQAVTSFLNLKDSNIAHSVRGVSQNFPLTQTIVAYSSKGVKNDLTFTQSISYIINRSNVVNHTLNFNQTIAISRSKTYKVHHGLGFNSFVKHQKVIHHSVESVLDWKQEVAREVHKETVAQVLGLGQTVEYTPVYPRSVESNLVFTQTIGLNRTTTQHVTSNLIFLPTRSVYVGMGDVTYYIMDNIQYVLIPAYKVGKKNNPHCILQVPNGAITLPSPDWGDTENYGGIFTIRRSMNGIPYTHVRSLSLRRLKLPWTLAKAKAWELREFLIQHNAELMTLTTWKGDKWFVNLTTNPFELAVRGRYEAENEKVSVELEFEGLKVQ